MTTVNNNAFNTTSYDMYQVDAFASKVFEGNPAAVIPMKGNTWFTDEKMQQIATENNLSETAFLISKDTTNNNNSDNNDNNNTCEYDIRWFTPNGEVDLCGHAPLGSAYVVFKFLKPPTMNKVQFNTQKNGALYVTKKQQLQMLTEENSSNKKNANIIGLLTMDFPADTPTKLITPDEILNKESVTNALNGTEVLDIFIGRDDLLIIVKDEDAIMNLKPNFSLIASILNTKYRGMNVTSASSSSSTYDCYSRSFFPTLGVNEDPVCGSAHCLISVYWSNITNKLELKARQASKRGGDVYIKLNKDKSRISLSGTCAMYMKATVYL